MGRAHLVVAKRAAALLAGLALVVGGVACGSSGSSSEVVVAQGVDPTTMDPTDQRELPTMSVLRHFYDSLLMRDREDSHEFNPILAESWRRVSPTAVEFKLRKGVEFEGGEPFDAESVKYTIDYLMGTLKGSQPKLLSFQFRTLAGAQVVDRYTVRILTRVPDPMLLDRLNLLMIVPKGADPKKLAREPNGTGPYRLVEWQRNNRVVMKSKPDYFRGKPRIQDVVFRTMPDPSARLAAIQAGDADVVTNVPADNTEEVESAGNASVETVSSSRIASVWLNTLEHPALRKPQVRQALNQAVNVDSIIKNVMSGSGVRVATFVPPYFAGYDESIQPIRYDPARAKQLLAQAGYADGFPLTMMVPRGSFALAPEIAQAIAADLGEVGVKVKLETVDPGVYQKALQVRKVPASFYGAWGEVFFNPIDEMQVAVRTRGIGSWYSNKQIDALIDRASVTLDQGKQDELIDQLQRELVAEAPLIFLFAYKDLYGVADRLDWKPRRDEVIYMYDASISD